MSNIRLANITRSQFRRAIAQKRLPQLSPDNLSEDQAVALAIWAVIVRRVPLPARASRIAFALAGRHARAILSDPGCWLFCAAWLSDEPEPVCVFSQRAVQDIQTEPGDGLASLAVVPLTPVAHELLGRLDALGNDGFLAVAA